MGAKKIAWVIISCSSFDLWSLQKCYNNNKNTLLGFSWISYTPSVTYVVKQHVSKSVDDKKHTKSLDISRLFLFVYFSVVWYFLGKSALGGDLGASFSHVLDCIIYFIFHLLRDMQVYRFSHLTVLMPDSSLNGIEWQSHLSKLRDMRVSEYVSGYVLVDAHAFSMCP